MKQFKHFPIVRTFGIQSIGADTSSTKEIAKLISVDVDRFVYIDAAIAAIFTFYNYLLFLSHFERKANKIAFLFSHANNTTQNDSIGILLFSICSARQRQQRLFS